MIRVQMNVVNPVNRSGMRVYLVTDIIDSYQEWSACHVMTPPVVPQVRPLYQHDCKGCKFLGHISTICGEADVYYHDNIPGYQPVLQIRYSDEPSDNATTPIGILDMFPMGEEWAKARKLLIL